MTLGVCPGGLEAERDFDGGTKRGREAHQEKGEATQRRVTMETWRLWVSLLPNQGLGPEFPPPLLAPSP